VKPEADPLLPLVESHQRRLYGFALCLAAGNEDQAYEWAADGLAEGLRESESERVCAAAARRIVAAARSAAASPSFPASSASPAQNASPMLRFVRSALYVLPFEERALVLLRDQLNLSYRRIAAIVGAGEEAVRRRTVSARRDLREGIAREVRRA